ncbi:hypothetical protein [Actinomycetospora sp. TBRC 11914]|uniref:hypothetical protein n=1 Tax=Actinomycetospora sp. TBRC 11914 TaxID=2729387 RepID=UPI00145DD561|nr:hypothetical protein [Actinomycetospora sp. TBRC 11914]NMO89555.1 hypothetical protein [Actinomycetospora sp. TBRC 11914]
MTTLEPARTATPSTADVERAVNGPGRRPSRLPRPWTIVTTGGMPGVMTLASSLCELGYRVPDFSVDVHEGVSCSSVSCTVALTTGECSEFAEQLRLLPGVLSVEPY